MDAKFLSLYNQELKFIRESGAEFAKEYPKIAGRLGIDGFDCADPYVERLLEGFAFLSARVHRKLDASFPEFTQHLLSLMFPTFLEPIPSVLIAQFNPDLDEGSLLGGVSVAKNTALVSQLGKDEQTPCEYRTVQEAKMFPVSIAHAEYVNAQDVVALTNNITTQKPAKSAIKLVLEAPPGLRFSAIEMDTLSLYIKGSESFPLYLFESMFKHFAGMLYKTQDSLWRNSQSQTRVVARGFDKQESLLPYCNRQFDGFRLLREYFVFPNRFLFLDIENIQSSLSMVNDNKVELLILLTESESKLENLVSEDNFALHCSPAINLFPKRAERIQLSQKSHEFHVVPDKLRPLDFEVCSITSIKGIGNSIEVNHPLYPLYSKSHDRQHKASQALQQKSFLQEHGNQRTSSPNAGFYTSKRVVRTLSVNERKFGHRSSYVGGEVYVSIVDPKASPYSEELQQLSVQTMCSNRDLPLMMPLGKGRTDFSIESGLPSSSVRCVGEPTRPAAPLNDSDNAWDLINLLSINFLGFSDEEEEQALTTLKKLLLLMSDKNSHTHSKQIDGIVGMNISKIMARLPMAGPICFANGLQISITLDETAYEGSSPFMLGMVLDQFFSQYVGINSFSKLVLISSTGQEIYAWPIRIGTHSAI